MLRVRRSASRQSPGRPEAGAVDGRYGHGRVGLVVGRVCQQVGCLVGGHLEPHGELARGHRFAVLGAVLPDHCGGPGQQVRGDDRQRELSGVLRGDGEVGGGGCQLGCRRRRCAGSGTSGAGRPVGRGGRSRHRRRAGRGDPGGHLSWSRNRGRAGDNAGRIGSVGWVGVSTVDDAAGTGTGTAACTVSTVDGWLVLWSVVL